MLAVGVCAVSRRPQPTPSAETPATTISSTAATSPPSSIATSVAAAPTTTGAAVEQPTTAPPVDAISLPGDVLAHTQAALTAWGVFAATYDLSVIDGTFVLDGPQYGQLAGEAEIQTGGTDDPPFEFLLAFPQVVNTEGNENATVRATVVIARNGEVAQEVEWDIEMQWNAQEGRWRLFKATETASG